MLLGYSNENKGYQLLSNGKFIISRYVFFEETQSQTIEQLENILTHLEKKVTQGKIVHQDKPTWIEK